MLEMSWSGMFLVSCPSVLFIPGLQGSRRRCCRGGKRREQLPPVLPRLFSRLRRAAAGFCTPSLPSKNQGATTVVSIKIHPPVAP
ncbi:hypothetical protein B0H10DRAFT_2011737 [Mycena sp. CBHHK59/15]|nr:hypothetical protein B0H10DRAFT_2011737 [Mycena sp. CBHHK59/15]